MAISAARLDPRDVRGGRDAGRDERRVGRNRRPGRDLREPEPRPQDGGEHQEEGRPHHLGRHEGHGRRMRLPRDRERQQGQGQGRPGGAHVGPFAKGGRAPLRPAAACLRVQGRLA